MYPTSICLGTFSISPVGFNGNLSLLDILWMDEILHHLLNQGSDDCRVNTKRSDFPCLLRGCEMDVATIHSVFSLLHFAKGC